MGRMSQLCRASLSRLHLGQESRLIGHDKEGALVQRNACGEETRYLPPKIHLLCWLSDLLRSQRHFVTQLLSPLYRSSLNIGALKLVKNNPLPARCTGSSFLRHVGLKGPLITESGRAFTFGVFDGGRTASAILPLVSATFTLLLENNGKNKTHQLLCGW
jgi:hypothetical protein